MRATSSRRTLHAPSSSVISLESLKSSDRAEYCPLKHLGRCRRLWRRSWPWVRSRYEGWVGPGDSLGRVTGGIESAGSGYGRS
jgi:hypothetical protein